MSTAFPEPNPLSMIPFGAFLFALAIAPSLPGKQWDRHHGKICAAFTALPISYYVFGLRAGSRVLHAGFEYGSFIVVVAGFFVVAGTIHFRVRGRGTPALNTLFLFAGALLGSLLGTVGASMLLIRPWIALNRDGLTIFAHTTTGDDRRGAVEFELRPSAAACTVVLGGSLRTADAARGTAGHARCHP